MIKIEKNQTNYDRNFMQLKQIRNYCAAANALYTHCELQIKRNF